jgi:ABC-2 type transport system permease protein
VNREHLQAFLWLRWRLRVNQFRKAGAVNAVFFAVLVALGLVAAVTLFIAGLLVGLYAFRGAPAYAHLFTWDGIVLAVLFGWMMGLVIDLQRAEALSLDRFLHLPVSLSGAFLINYLSSLFSLTLIVFVPGMVGLIIGLTISHGPIMLLELPLLAAALFALTAVTYQFQGWLASLMANPRRRRTIIVLVTGGFILLSQAPNLINIARPWETVTEPMTRLTERSNEAMKAREAGQITVDEFTRRLKEINEQYETEKREKEQQALDRAVRTAHVLNTVLPPGWLPLGAEGLADGAVIPALLGTLGLTLIGSVSLWLAYRTTLRLYTGEFTATERKAAAKAPAAPPDPTRVRLVERQLPWVGEHVSAVATAGLRSLTRAPEAKMAFLAPLIMVVVFGGLTASGGGNPPAALRPLLAYGTAGMVLLIAGVQLMGNQFGYDRTGFRAYVLSPLPRRDILLGKNLAVAPLVLGLGLLAFVVPGVVFPMRIDHYPAVLAQMLSTYLILCMLSNVLAILTPIPLAPGSLQPASIKAGPVLMQMLVMLLLPVFVLPVLAPYGLEVLLAESGVVKGVPISLPLSVVVLVLVGLVYRWVIRRQGDWLAAREQRILEVVTSRAE